MAPCNLYRHLLANIGPGWNGVDAVNNGLYPENDERRVALPLAIRIGLITLILELSKIFKTENIYRNK